MRSIKRKEASALLTFGNSLVPRPTVIVQRLLQFLRDRARQAVFLRQGECGYAEADFKRDDEAEENAERQEGAVVLFDGTVETCREIVAMQIKDKCAYFQHCFSINEIYSILPNR